MMGESPRRVDAFIEPIPSSRPTSESHRIITRSHNSKPKSSAFVVDPVFHVFLQILDFLSTVGILGFSIIIPLVCDSWKTRKMVKNFIPSRDIHGLEGKIVLVTGGSGGLGKQTIAYLASHKPMRIYLAARNQTKARKAIADIESWAPNTCEIVHLPLDLSSLASVAECAAEFKARESRLDILINNAGVMAMPYAMTDEGYEIQFGTNHMGHALLTRLLLTTMLETAKQPDADVRIITVTSMGHYLVPSQGIEFVQTAHEKINKYYRYGSSKLANLLFSRELAARYPSLTAVAVHPGVIITDLFSSMQTNIFFKLGIWIYRYLAMILPGHYKDSKGGALCQTWCASTAKENLQSGAFYVPIGRKHRGSAQSRDPGLQKKLWDWTESELQRHGY